MVTKFVRVKNFSEICHINNKQILNVMNNVNLTMAKIYNEVTSKMSSGDTVFNEETGLIIDYDHINIDGREASTIVIKIGDWSKVTILLNKYRNGSASFSYTTNGKTVEDYEDLLKKVYATV